ncbi:arrestin domain-containing protein 2-like [Toxorhynchites rutilus septentrionalis]|uniref:arrestin domain-containing protein 2-like n=1 Tax=Toxorhynchites rutilus septentrionalis TaxID=329112 RepID=UPI0024785B6C|nr:arrestin domain-containing protein 2-like [Toxorhynchites rutilus septentrionalis]
MTHCEIKFDGNPLGIFQSGQTLSGCVELRLVKPKKISGFILTLSGNAEAKWSENHDKDTTTYTGNEVLLTSESVLVSPSYGETIEMPAGLHVYNFSCVLPPHLPSSYEGKHGRIRYTASAVLVRPWKFNQSCKVAFTVLRPFDPSQFPELRNSINLEQVITFCCWPCRSRPLLITVGTPMNGYVAGQIVDIVVTLDNRSSVSVFGVTSKLKRTVYFISQRPSKKTKEVTETLSTVRSDTYDDNATRCLQKLEIPCVVPTTSSSILIINYKLFITIEVDGCHRNPKFQIPIIIGTVPFINRNYGTFANVSSPSAPPLAPDELPPPTFEEAMNATPVNVNDDENAIGSQPYVPRYPVYKFETLKKC